ncbi:hypothetical protein [Corynebacterium singulare]|uniref:Uncharacterized protein n=1 Tax=Corynebacterium singulare TaxID=161899 RepID=A0ABS9PSR9_9CORY|nr:hypothetical protein [Corynebacterium singulare]MCG7275737.1 hypothetical protein [Corynebacterium singulare]
MRIFSLESFPPVDSDYAVLLESSEMPHVLPPAAGSVTFCFTRDQLADVDPLPIVLIDIQPDVAMEVLRSYVDAGRHIEYWAPRTDTSNLRQLVADHTGELIAVAGVNLSDGWIQVRMEQARNGDRSSEDWLEGLKVTATPSMVSQEPVATAATTVTLRSLLISRVTPLAKPFKKYLPGSVVILMYKVLERIR